MNRKLIVSILAIILALTMVLSLVVSVIPVKSRAEGISVEGAQYESAEIASAGDYTE